MGKGDLKSMRKKDLLRTLDDLIRSTCNVLIASPPSYFEFG